MYDKNAATFKGFMAKLYIDMIYVKTQSKLQGHFLWSAFSHKSFWNLKKKSIAYKEYKFKG